MTSRSAAPPARLAVSAAIAVTGGWLTAGPCAGAEAGPAFAPDVRSMMETHCFDCHTDGAKKGGVAFDEHGSDAALLADKPLWHRVLKNVRAGLMPPPEKKQPAADQRAALQQWIKASVLQLDPAMPDPGRPVLRRLNRTEYRNTIRDLTGVDFRVDEEFPADDTGHGFDNIGEVLTVSPMMLEKYLTAAKTIVSRAVPQTTRVMPEDRVGGNRFHRIESKDGKWERGAQLNTLSYYEPATIAAEVTVKHPGSYALTFDLKAREKYVEGEVDLNRVVLKFKADGKELGKREFGHAGGRDYQSEYTCELSDGPHEVVIELERLTPDINPVRSLTMELNQVTLRGPADEKFWDRPDNYDRWFPREPPAGNAERLAFAGELLEKFAARAFRRPVDAESIQRLTKLAESVWSQSGQGFESGVSRAMEAVLTSPRFLFREEYIEPAPAGGAHPLVDEYSLASRLSYFLWSTMPDEELLRLAAEGKLRAEIGAQFQRMLADDRGKAFSRNFAGQWLQARDIEGIPIDARFVLARELKPDPEAEKGRERFQELRRKEATELTDAEKAELETLRGSFRRRNRFPNAEFSSETRRDMRRETEMFFEHIIREDRPLTELIDSDYTFLNRRLAEHYGVSGVEGGDFRKVSLPADSPRGGVLTQGTVLAVTSNPTRTSPVKRGLFILDNFLGTPPPPPPPDIPALEDFSRGRRSQGTLRETLAKHRADAKCASCHDRMDPLGLAFENFNAMGKWRDVERGVNIDATGKLVSGEEFNGAKALKRILVTQHRDAFHRCFTEKLLIYALGRGLTYADETTVDLLLDKLNKAEGKAKALLRGIVESDAFLRRRATNTEKE